MVPIQRFRNEVHTCSLLSEADAFLVGMYSTQRHPFGLVYEYMDNLDLKQYLTNEPEVEKLKLVAILFHVVPVLAVTPSDSP